VDLEPLRNPKTPRQTALALLRQLNMDDLLEVTVTASIPADLRRNAEDAVINRIPALSLGERVSMARRATGRVAGVLLLDREIRVVETALTNGRLTEELVVKALSLEAIHVDAVEKIAGHERWSLAYGVKLALLRQPLTSLGRVLGLAPLVKRNDLLEISGDPRMPLDRRKYLIRLAKQGREKRPFAI
jgi:hypothetical protein